MSEFSSSSPNAPSSIVNLPQDFLNIDPARVEVSSRKHRSMAELRVAVDQLNEHSSQVADIVGHGCEQSEEESDALRHVNRGIALTQLLLADSVSNFPPDEGEYFLSRVEIPLRANPRRDLFWDARDELVDARRSAMLPTRRGLSSEEAAQNEGDLKRSVNGVLGKVGLSGYFETAVQNLDGPGLEVPTRELDAKYGAALVAISFGIIKA